MGQLQVSGVGFYRSEYKIDGQTRYLATRQFEASYARYAFPLFDGSYGDPIKSFPTKKLIIIIHRTGFQSNFRASTDSW